MVIMYQQEYGTVLPISKLTRTPLIQRDVIWEKVKYFKQQLIERSGNLLFTF